LAYKLPLIIIQQACVSWKMAQW